MQVLKLLQFVVGISLDWQDYISQETFPARAPNFGELNI